MVRVVKKGGNGDVQTRGNEAWSSSSSQTSAETPANLQDLSLELPCLSSFHNTNFTMAGLVSYGSSDEEDDGNKAGSQNLHVNRTFPQGLRGINANGTVHR